MIRIRVSRVEQIILRVTSLIIIMHTTMTSDSAGGRDGALCLATLNVSISWVYCQYD